jgi:hypothetical protein
VGRELSKLELVETGHRLRRDRVQAVLGLDERRDHTAGVARGTDLTGAPLQALEQPVQLVDKVIWELEAVPQIRTHVRIMAGGSDT